MTRVFVNKANRPHYGLALVTVLVLVGWGLRVYQIDRQELRGDEAFSWNYVAHESGASALTRRIVTEGDPHPPLHYLVLQGWVSIFGDSEWAMRTPSAFLSLMLIPIVYQFAARSASQSVGIVVAAITSLHPFQIWLAQDVRNMYQIAIGFGMVSTLLLPNLLRGKFLHWFGYVLCGTIAMYSHYYALFGLLAHGMFVALSSPQQGRRGGMVWWVSAGASILMLVLPWAFVMLPIYAQGQLSDPAQMALGEYLVRTGSSLALGLTIGSEIGFVAAGVSLLLCIVGTVYALRNCKRSWAGLLTTWPLMALLGIYVVTYQRATFNTFYFLVAFPAAYTLLALGWLSLLEYKNISRWVASIAGVMAIAGASLALCNYYFRPEWSKNRGMREIASIVEMEGRSGDLYITNFPDPAQDYYLRNLASLPVYMLPRSSNDEPNQVKLEISSLAKLYDRLWFVPVHAVQWDSHGLVQEQLSTRFVREASYNQVKLDLMRFVVDPNQANGYQHIDADFNGGIKLVGSHVLSDDRSVDEGLFHGSLIRVTLLWVTGGQIKDNYTVFVHALGMSDQPIAQHDGVPQFGARPTSTWKVGETIVDVHQFTLPEIVGTGKVKLAVGMYLPLEGQRLSVSDGSDHVIVAEYTRNGHR